MRKILLLALATAAFQLPSLAAQNVDSTTMDLIHHGQIKQAQDLELKAHADEPKNLQHLKALTFIYLLQGDPQTALQYAQRAVQVAPADPVVHYNLGGMYQSMRRFGDAIKEYDNVQMLDKTGNSPVVAEAWVNLADL